MFFLFSFCSPAEGFFVVAAVAFALVKAGLEPS